MIECEPLFCAIDDETYQIIINLCGRKVAEKFLYEGTEFYPIKFKPPDKEVG